MTKSITQCFDLERYQRLWKESEEKKKESEALKEKSTTVKNILLAIQGLEKTRKKHLETEVVKSRKRKEPYDGWRSYDPGKYDTAYYFVKEITRDEIIASKKFKPQLYEQCPKCNKKVPVVMWYTQTYDSPDGDTWEAEAFTICCDRIKKIKHVGTDYRFLNME